ncbi:MAG: rhomboid family intramembrane serine protease [Myxococcota bacterium]
MPLPDPLLRALHRLIAHHDGYVIHKSADAFGVRIGDDAVVLLAAHGQALPPNARAVVESVRGRRLHIVLVGGGRAAKGALRGADLGTGARHWGIRSHLAEDGTVWSEGTWTHGWLAKELGNLAHEPAMDPDSVDPADDEARPELPEHPEDVPLPGEHRPLLVTPVLAAVLVGMFVLQTVWGGSEFVPTLVRMGASVPGANLSEPWRSLSSSLLHIGALHLFLNVVGLVWLGHLLERLLGPSRFLVLYVLSVIGGSVLSALFTGGVSAGASSGLWGLGVAEVVVLWRHAHLVERRYVRSARGRVAKNLVVNSLASISGGVDLFAHLGGGLVGVALVGSGLLLRGLESGMAPPQSRALRGLAVASGIALGVAGVTAIGVGRPWALVRAPVLIEHTWEGATVSIPAELGPLAAPRRVSVPKGLFGASVAGEAEAGALYYDPAVVGVTFAPYAEGPLSLKAAEARARAEEDRPACRDTSYRLSGTPRLLLADCSSWGGFRGQSARYYGTTGTTDVNVLMWADAPAAWLATIGRILRSVEGPDASSVPVIVEAGG